MSRIIDDRSSISDNEEALFEEFINRRIYDVHTAQPAEVISFDNKNATVDLRLGVMRDIKGIPQSVNILTGVPVCYPVSGNYKFEFPIEKGATGLVIFCESSIDTWLQNTDDDNIAMNPQDTRMHDYSDGVFILGMRQYNKVEEIDSSNLVIKAKDTKITLDPEGKFQIKAQGIDFMTVLLLALDKANGFTGGALTPEIELLRKITI
jgi:hypothetical protein